MEGKLILTAIPLRIKNFLLDHFLRSSWDLDCNLDSSASASRKANSSWKPKKQKNKKKTIGHKNVTASDFLARDQDDACTRAEDVHLLYHLAFTGLPPNSNR
jgi:hypothetical protein